jgi:hypothetical protein
MSDYFDQVERELSAALRRNAHLPWYLRIRVRNSRSLAAVLAALVIAGPAVAAVSLLQSGSSVKPSLPPTAKAFNGVAVKHGGELLPLRVSDPAAGPPWGMKLIRTTRGLLCVQVGRVAFATVGALGRDGAFNDDGRFHPYSVNYETGAPCVAPDGRGNGFLNVASYQVAASALLGPGSDGCRTSAAPAGERRAQAYNRRPLCKRADLRDIYYGLLGPDAVSVTYRSASGRLLSKPTAGSDGAYLVVLSAQGQHAHPGVSFGGGTGSTIDAALFPGAIQAVRYRDGHVCRVAARLAGGKESCPPVGYVSPTGQLPTPTQVASKISVRVEPSKYYCDKPPPSELVVPCPHSIPLGFRRIDMSRGPTEVLVIISFASTVAIKSGRSYYYFQTSRASHPDPRYSRGGNSEECGNGGDFGQTNSDYRRGQLVSQYLFEGLSCRGLVHGDISLVILNGPASPAPTGAIPGQTVGRRVGSFSFAVP